MIHHAIISLQCPCSWQKTFLKNIEHLYILWKKFCNDPFRWQIIKSTVWFTLALTLFSEMRSVTDDAKKKPIDG